MAGKEYKIMARSEGFPDVTGKCSVPEVKDLNIKIDTLTETFEDQWGTYSWRKINVTFQDIPNENDYYNLFGYVSTTNAYGSSSNSLRIQDQNNNTDLPYQIFSDRFFEGKVYSTTLYDPNNYYFNDTSLYSAKYTFDILKTDYDYYQYHTSLFKYHNVDNPFTEFSPVYSNLEGGYGIFCSYLKYEKSLKIK
jgi:hypothetical protein